MSDLVLMLSIAKIKLKLKQIGNFQILLENCFVLQVYIACTQGYKETINTEDIIQYICMHHHCTSCVILEHKVNVSM